jgi:hypothetical protein
VFGHCGVVRFYEYALGWLIAGAWLVITAAGWKLGTSRRRSSAIFGLVFVLLAAAGIAIATVRTFRVPESTLGTEPVRAPAVAPGEEQ